MAQLSEKLVRDAIKCIREERKLMLTINEVDQALHAWLTLNEIVQPTQETAVAPDRPFNEQEARAYAQFLDGFFHKD